MKQPCDSCRHVQAGLALIVGLSHCLVAVLPG